MILILWGTTVKFSSLWVAMFRHNYPQFLSVNRQVNVILQQNVGQWNYYKTSYEWIQINKKRLLKRVRRQSRFTISMLASCNFGDDNAATAAAASTLSTYHLTLHRPTSVTAAQRLWTSKDLCQPRGDIKCDRLPSYAYLHTAVCKMVGWLSKV